MRKFFLFTILSSFFSLSLYAHGPTRQQVVESIVINAPVDKVWAVVGDFSALHTWHPAIQSTEMKGDDVRILTLAPGKIITEKLVKKDDEKKKLKYKIKDMTIVETFQFAGLEVKRPLLPVNNYTGFLSVKAEGDGSKVTWKGKFYRPYLLNPPTPEGMSDKEAIKAISEVYKAGLDNLKELMEKGDSTASSSTTSESTTSAPAAPTAPAAPSPPETPAAVAATTAAVLAKANKTVAKKDFDPAVPYQAHLKCEEGKKCKIDKFLLKGFRAFSQCQVCHGIDGNGSTIAPSLVEKLKKEVTYDIFVDRVTNGFKGQIGVMPPWGKNPNIMKNKENLFAYLKARSDGIIPAGRLKKFKH